MPRRTRRRRRRIGQIVARRTGSKMAGNVAQTAMAGYNLAKRLARLINVENKHFTQTITEQANYSPTIIDLCDPVQGHDQDERSGDSIKPLHLTVRGFIYADTGQTTVEYVRIIVFRYKDENGQTIGASDILATVGSAAVVNSPKAWDKRFHSKILYDKTFSIGYSASGTADANVPHTRRFVIDKKLYGHINWSDSTSTQEGGGLYMLVTSSNALDANSPTVDFISRVVFTDN